MDSELRVDAVDQPSTHASRHPEKPTILPRKHIRSGKTSAEKATNAVRRALKREQEAAMEADIQNFVEYRNTLAKELAQKYSKSLPYMHAQLSRVLLLKQRRHSNVRNALVAKRSRELNAGRSKGNRYSLQQVQAIVRDEVEEGMHAEVEEIEELLADHNESRENKKTGARSSNRAATLDYNACYDRVREEVSNAQASSKKDHSQPAAGEYVRALRLIGLRGLHQRPSFLNEVLDITPYELVKKFEIWACAKDRTQKKNNTEVLRSECVNIIANGLHMIVGRKKINMQYERYAVEIVEKHGVELQGWPTGIKFRSPASISATEELTSLRDALACGECRWVKLNRKEIDARTKERKEKIASGEITVRKRKTRKDKGEKRGPNKATTGKRKRGSSNDDHEAADADGNAEETGVSRAKRKRNDVAKQLPPAMAALSTEFVRDSSEEAE
ncbi:hypothetical protein H0H92_014805 [Tricholoma furcatifolium]|nr:hypothetical protein H0H92_014805 [Tricholoma furcatifolium]